MTEEIERFFSEVRLPQAPFRLNEVMTIIDIELFISSHLAIARAHEGNKRYRPYLERLIELKNRIVEEKTLAA